MNFFFSRFCVAVRRKNYPSETESLMVSPKDMSRWIQPAHTISFVPPVTIVNLLPCHLSFRIVGCSKTNTDVSPGKKSFISVSEYILLHSIVLLMSDAPFFFLHDVEKLEL